MCTAPVIPPPGTAQPGITPQAVALILLNFEGAGDTLACLEALAAMPDAPGRVIVVDNGSQDDSAPAIRAWLDAHGAPLHGELLPLPENRGYAAGNNAGIRRALEDSGIAAFWLLNNDTEPQPGALAALCDAVTHGAAMAGSSLVYAHATDLLQCAAGYSLNAFFGTTAAIYGKKPLHTAACNTFSPGDSSPLGTPPAAGGFEIPQTPSTGVAREASRSAHPSQGPRRLDYICGASLLVRRDVVETIGLLAEEYFLYYEDAEYGLRAKRAGYALAWASGSIVRHKEGGATGAATQTASRDFQRPESVDYLSLRNRIWLMRNYFPLALPVAIAGYLGVACNRIRRGQGNRLRLVFRALRDGLAGRMGQPPDMNAASVLFITARADFGGGPEHLWQLLRHLPGDIVPHVACPRDYPYHDRFSELVGAGNMAEIPHRKFTLAALLRLRRFCKKNGITVLHSHGKGAGLYSRLLTLLTGIPCVHTFHGVHMDAYGPLKRRLYRLYERWASWITTAGIAVSWGEKQRILHEGLMPETTLRCIPNGVPIPEEPIAESAETPYRVVSLSRFDFQKNSAFLVDVLEALHRCGRMREFQFDLIGDGVEKNDIMRLAVQRGVTPCMRFIEATLTPHTYFVGAFCYISSSRWEGMPLGVLEAMAHGLPPVASDVVGNRDAVVHEGTGLLYPQGDSVAAAAALCRLADDAALKKTLGEKARTFVRQHHDVRQMVLHIAALLRQARQPV